MPLGASVDLAAVRGADLVLFCVKSTDTESVAREMAPHLDPDAVVVSLQNGVENAATIARHVRQIVVPAVVYVATAMPEPGRQASRPRRSRHRPDRRGGAQRCGAAALQDLAASSPPPRCR